MILQMLEWTPNIFPSFYFEILPSCQELAFYKEAPRAFRFRPSDFDDDHVIFDGITVV